MKIAALARGADRDVKDIQILAGVLGIKSAAEAAAVYHSYFERTPLSREARLSLFDILGSAPPTDPENADEPTPKPF